jgi:cell division protein FtsB
VQKEFLADLYALRDALAADLGEGAPGGETSETQVKEVEALKEENKKLKYRIAHMKRYL